MKTYLVEYDPVGGEPNGYYVKMTDAQALSMRRHFQALQTEKVIREWRVDDVDTLAISYADFADEEEWLLDLKTKNPKDWHPRLPR